MTEEEPRDRIHIDSSITIRTGHAAERALTEQNDAAFVEASRGILRVPRERWVEAQTTERNHWFGGPSPASDDRNFVHYRNFGGYKVLDGMHFPRAIELGCGPFTNMRLIARKCEIDQLDLLDPLLDEYLAHRNTYITKSELIKSPRNRYFPRLYGLGPELWRRFARRWGWTTPIRNRFPVPIEDFDPEDRYEFVVMINVLEHCFDFDLIQDKIASMVAPGGILVFADRIYDPEEVKKNALRLFDAAHPLRVTEQAIAPLLARFSALWDRRFPAEEPIYEKSQELYFIGRWKGNG